MYVLQPDGSYKWVADSQPTQTGPGGLAGGANPKLPFEETGIGKLWTQLNRKTTPTFSVGGPTQQQLGQSQIGSNYTPGRGSLTSQLGYSQVGMTGGVMVGPGGAPVGQTPTTTEVPTNEVPPTTGTLGSDIVSGTATTDWTKLFQQFRAAGIDAAEATRLAQQQAAENTYAAQMRIAQTTARQNQMAAQQARQQISEQDFLRQRQIMQGAQARGLGASGIEQLAQTQARMQTGQNVNQLVQQEMMANEKLQNYIAGVEADKGQKLANADAQYYDNLFKLAGNDLENAKFLDSTQYRDKVFEWQQKNAADIAANNNLNTRLDLIRIMESQDLSDAGKKAVAAMMIDGGKISEQEGNDLLDQYLGASTGDRIVKGSFDWTTAIAVGSLAAVGIAAAVAFPPIAGGLMTGALGGAGLTVGGTAAAVAGGLTAGAAGGVAAGAVGGGIGNLLQNLSGNIKFNLPGFGEWEGTRAEAIDKNSPDSLVTQAFGDKQAFKDIDFILDGTTIKYNYKGVTYDKFNDAQAAWLRTQGR